MSLGRSGLAQGVTALVLVTSPAGDRTVDPHSAGVSQAALTEENCPPGGLACAYLSAPQQATVPMVVRPQLCHSPVLSWANSTSGGLDCSWSSSPQQETEPLGLNPQE